MANRFKVPLKTCEGTLEPLLLNGEGKAKRHCIGYTDKRGQHHPCGKPISYYISRSRTQVRCQSCNAKWAVQQTPTMKKHIQKFKLKNGRCVSR